MKLLEILFPAEKADERPPAGDCLSRVFELLTHRDSSVAAEIALCLKDTRGYFLSRADILERRGLKYAPDAEPWLRVVAAAQAALSAGYLTELPADCGAQEFASAVRSVLSANGIAFDPSALRFDPSGGISRMAALFNEYAGQSGITLYFIELYGEKKTMGAAMIADYAEASEIADSMGVSISTR